MNGPGNCGMSAPVEPHKQRRRATDQPPLHHLQASWPTKPTAGRRRRPSRSPDDLPPPRRRLNAEPISGPHVAKGSQLVAETDPLTWAGSTDWVRRQKLAPAGWSLSLVAVDHDGGRQRASVRHQRPHLARRGADRRDLRAARPAAHRRLFAMTVRRRSTTCSCTTGWRSSVTAMSAIRALSGVLSVASLPLAWFAGRRVARVAAAFPRSHRAPRRSTGPAPPSLLLFATSPYAIRYGSEDAHVLARRVPGHWLFGLVLVAGAGEAVAEAAVGRSHCS